MTYNFAGNVDEVCDYLQSSKVAAAKYVDKKSSCWIRSCICV